MAIQRPNRSAGPKTAEGKLAVSNNALKTGSYSSRVVLPGESEEDFKQLQEQFLKDFLPKNVAESQMVHELSGITWKILRLERFEDAHFLRSQNRSINEHDLREEGLKLNPEYVDLVQDVSIFTDEFFTLNQTHLEYLRRFEDGYGISKDEFCEIPVAYPDLYEELARMAKAFIKDDSQDVKPEALITLKYYPFEGDPVPYLHYAFKRLRARCEHLVYIYHNLRIRSVVTNIRERRLLEALKDQGIMRAHEDLQRGFYKALSELRRHQTWRHQTIDVKEEA
jgi:hypothetical protein